MYRMIFLLLIWPLVVSANQEPHDMMSADSLLIDLGQEQAWHVVHMTQPKQTLYSIAKFYNISLDDVYMSNPELSTRVVRENEAIRIPISKDVVINPQATEGPKLYYRVKSKETLFRIARVYFDMTIEHLMAINQLSEPVLEIDQLLYIGRLMAPTDHGDEVNSLDSLSTTDEWALLNWTEAKSIAYWLKGSTDTGSLVVLHDSAPLNSTVSITNPMYGKSVDARVIGRIPPNVYPNDIDIILSKAVADELGAIDARFYVKVRHVTPW